MRINRKKHSPEFKAKVALSAIREEATISELSSRYQINANMISKWKKQALSQFVDIFSSKQEKQEISNDSQIKELHAKIGELTVEKDFLYSVSMRFAPARGR